MFVCSLRKINSCSDTLNSLQIVVFRLLTNCSWWFLTHNNTRPMSQSKQSVRFNQHERKIKTKQCCELNI